jgi:Domain of unknown function (DUF4292)
VNILKINYYLLKSITGLLLLTLLFSACQRSGLRKSQRKQVADSIAVALQTTSQNTIKKDSVAKTIEPEEIKITEQTVDFKYLNAKSKVSFKSADQNIDDANLNIRIRKDSVIWFQVTVFGIEGARGIISRDTIKLLDRVHNDYYIYNFESLSKAFNFKLSFDLLQSILIGNMPIPKQPNQRFKKEKDYFLLKQNEGKVLIDNYIGEQNRRLKKLMVTDQPTKNTLMLDYDDFQALNNYLFPHTSLMQLDYQSLKDNQKYQTVFKIKHQKIELSDNPLSFPFSIPAKFNRK